MFELSEADLATALAKDKKDLARHEAIALLIRKETQLDDNLELYHLGQSVQRAAGRMFTGDELKEFDDMLEAATDGD